MGCHLFCCSALSEQGSEIHSGDVRFCFRGADVVTALLGEEWDEHEVLRVLQAHWRLAASCTMSPCVPAMPCYY